MDPWVREAAAEIGKRAVRELEALVGVCSPSGDIHGAEECAAVCAALLPDEAAIERIPCSSPDHAPDLLAHLTGTGSRRVLLLGHLDTVDRPPGPQAAHAPGRQARRLRRDRHEGRRRARHRDHARAGQAPRRLRRARPAAGLRRGVADRLARPRAPLRGLGRVPVLRGRRADLERRRRRGGAAQGGRDDPRDRPRPRRALGLGARPRPQRAAGARLRRAGRRRLPRPARPAPPDRGADRAALRRGVQRRARRTASCSATAAPTS